MGYGGSGQPRKFYWKQVTRIQELLEKKVAEQDAKIDYEKYLRICEQLGEEPDPKRMPLETSAFPAEVQVAFFIFDLMTDNWEGNTGSYLGKNWSSIEFLFDTYEVEDRPTVVYFLKSYEILIVNYKAEEAERKRKAEERKAQRGGKNYTYNVKG